MLQMVPLPVALIVSAPGPKYSTILFVPPLTVSKPQRYRITSLGEAQPLSFPVNFTPINFGWSTSQGRPAITSPARAPPTPMANPPNPPPFRGGQSGPVVSAPRHADS